MALAFLLIAEMQSKLFESGNLTIVEKHLVMVLNEAYRNILFDIAETSKKEIEEQNKILLEKIESEIKKVQEAGITVRNAGKTYRAGLVSGLSLARHLILKKDEVKE